MNTYAAHIDADNIVTEVIVGTAEWGEQNIGGNWVDVTETTGYPGIGWEWLGDVFRSPQPSPDCVWDDDLNVWVCPEPNPLPDA
jgi:hypothetical protein